MTPPPRRLSRSIIWDLQRRYFDEHGVSVWNQSVVPQYVTSNPWIADGYAAVTGAWLRDLAAGGALDRSAPLYVVELGCGSGRFGFHFLRRLVDDVDRSPLHGLQLRYVYTDFTEYNLDVLRSNPAVQRFVEAGQLDFARFDAGSDRTLQLGSGEVLDAAALVNPLAVLANYVFDGVPQDCFRVANGELYETLARDDPGATRVEDAIRSWKQRPAAPDYYDDPSWNRILEWYRVHVRQAGFSFPTAALTCLEHLHELSRGRLLVLSADKGYAHEEAAAVQRAPELAFHGSVSMMVNYHAVGRWVEDRGGTFLRPSLRNSSLTVAACLFGEGGWPETRLAFEAQIDRRGPDDFFAMKRFTQRHYQGMDLEELLAWLRLSGWDHVVFAGMLPALVTHARNASPLDRTELRMAAQNVWEAWFPLHEHADLPFHAGLLLMEAGAPLEALEMFERSVALFGPDATALVHMAFCHLRAGHAEPAAECARRALELQPDCAPARELLAKLPAV